MVDGALTLGYACAFSSTVLACSTADTEPFVPTLMASTPRLSSRVAGTFAAGQVIPADVVPDRGPSNPSSGNAAAVAPAGQRPRAGTAASCAHETTPAGAGTRPLPGGAGAVADQRPRDGQPRVRADHDHPLDAVNPAQLCRKRRVGRGRSRACLGGLC